LEGDQELLQELLSERLDCGGVLPGCQVPIEVADAINAIAEAKGTL
jgi:hypothetical protein